MVDGHDSGGHAGEGSSHESGNAHHGDDHHDGFPDHENGHHKHHHHHSHNDPLDHQSDYAPAYGQYPETNPRWRQALHEAEDEDPEQQPLLTGRSRRVAPGPIVAVLSLIVVIGVLQIVIVTMKSKDGYTGSGAALD